MHYVPHVLDDCVNCYCNGFFFHDTSMLFIVTMVYFVNIDRTHTYNRTSYFIITFKFMNIEASQTLGRIFIWHSTATKIIKRQIKCAFLEKFISLFLLFFQIGYIMFFTLTESMLTSEASSKLKSKIK